MLQSNAGNEEIVAKLLEAGANRNTRLHDNERGETPLATAARRGHSRIVLLLTNEQADTNCWMSSVCVEDFRKIVDIRAKDKIDRELDRSIAIEKGIETLDSLFACILVGGTIVTAVILARGRQRPTAKPTSTHVGRFLQMYRRK